MTCDSRHLFKIFFFVLHKQILDFTWIVLYAFVFSLEFGFVQKKAGYVFCTTQKLGLLHSIIPFCIYFLKIILVNRNVREDDLFKICIYLRSYGIFDQADQERIFNNLVFCTPERKASELLTEIGKRGQHVYWHLAHALQTRQTPMFNFFHGGEFQCCVM